MRKTIFQVGGAIVSAVATTISLVSDYYGFVPNTQWQIIALIGFIFFAIFVCWIIWDKQSQINKFTSGIYLDASLNPITFEIDKDIVIDIEIWTDKDIHTDNIILNFEAVRGLEMLNTPWWNIPKLFGFALKYFPSFKFFKKMFHLETERGEYRKHIKCSDNQPFKDTITIQTSGVKEDMLKWSNIFLMELVLITGIPNGKFRKYLAVPKENTLEPI